MPKYILQELPKGMTKGENVVYPKIQTYTTHDFETVLEHMKTYANVSTGTMRAVLEALAMTMTSWMPLGHNIKVDGLGTFSLSLGYEGKELKEKYNHIYIKGINFKPDPELLADLNKESNFERSEMEVKSPKKSELSLEERIAKAKAVIEEKGFMTLNDYARITGFRRTASSLDLKKIVASPTSGITTQGSGSHKVWIKKEIE
jgi:predicted histone-like DNA-binding protein